MPAGHAISFHVSKNPLWKLAVLIVGRKLELFLHGKHRSNSVMADVGCGENEKRHLSAVDVPNRKIRVEGILLTSIFVFDIVEFVVHAEVTAVEFGELGRSKVSSVDEGVEDASRFVEGICGSRNLEATEKFLPRVCGDGFCLVEGDQLCSAVVGLLLLLGVHVLFGVFCADVGDT